MPSAALSRDSRANRGRASLGLVLGAGGGAIYKTTFGPLIEAGFKLNDIGQVALSAGWGFVEDKVGKGTLPSTATCRPWLFRPSTGYSQY